MVENISKFSTLWAPADTFSGRCLSCASQRLQGVQSLPPQGIRACLLQGTTSAGGNEGGGGSLLSSAGGLLRARCHLRWAGWFPCRAADVKHLSARSLPGTPVGRAVVLMVIIIR